MIASSDHNEVLSPIFSLPPTFAFLHAPNSILTPVSRTYSSASTSSCSSSFLSSSSRLPCGSTSQGVALCNTSSVVMATTSSPIKTTRKLPSQRKKPRPMRKSPSWNNGLRQVPGSGPGSGSAISSMQNNESIVVRNFCSTQSTHTAKIQPNKLHSNKLSQNKKDTSTNIVQHVSTTQGKTFIETLNNNNNHLLIEETSDSMFQGTLESSLLEKVIKFNRHLESEQGFQQSQQQEDTRRAPVSPTVFSTKKKLSRQDEYELALSVQLMINAKNVKEIMTKRNGGREPRVVDWANELQISPVELQIQRQRGIAATNRLVEGNLSLVSVVIGKLPEKKTRNIPRQDLIQEGSIGLIKAAERFDPLKGYRFGTFAEHWVRASVLRFIDTKTRTIHIPSSITESYRKIQVFSIDFLKKNGRHPDDEEVAQGVGMTTFKLKFVVSMYRTKTSSYDVPLRNAANEEKTTIADFIEGSDNVQEKLERDLLKQDIDKVLKKTLRPQERAALILRYGLEDGIARTLDEVGEIMRLSRMRICNIIQDSMAKLRDNAEAKELLAYYM